MAIRGRLDELQAPEVLQFLTQSGRTGTLRLEDGRWSKFLAFENGRLVFAVSQHTLPPLADVLYQRGTIDSSRVQSELRFDDEVTKALEWRRSGEPARTPGEFARTRLGRILIERGRITEADLAAVMDPKRIPESVLEEVLIHAGALTRDAITDVRRLAPPNSSLHAAIIKTRALTQEQISESIACMPEKCLARLLVFFGHVKNNEASYCAEQLDNLRGQSRPSFRIGEYLVSRGKLGQRQLERALGAQLTRRSLLGAILIDQEVLTREDIAEAEREVAELRMEFSPLRMLRNRLIREYDFTAESFAQARISHLQSGHTLAEALIGTDRVDEADLRQLIGDILTVELSDLMLWTEGTYEFFDGFSLADAIGDDGLGRIHDFSFEVSSLLLDAHYRVDELRRTSFQALGPKSILHATDIQASSDNLKPTDGRLIDRMNGRRPLAEVCAVLPGNLLSHCERVARFIDSGWARTMTRTAAYKKGQDCVAAGNHEQAITYFEHALHTPGDGPEPAEVQMWIQHSRLLGSRSVLRRFTHGVARSLRYVRNLNRVRRALDWCARHEAVARPCGWMSDSWQNLRSRWGRSSRRLALTFQDFMIQNGLARHWWTVRRRLLNPVAGWGGRRAPKVLTIAVIFAMTSLALVIPGVTSVAPDANTGKVVGGTPFRALRSPIRKLRFDAPVDVAPAISDVAAYVVSRDGVLRSLPLTGGAKAKGWKVQLGEYGDLLSTPTLFRDRLYVANVRGSVHAITTDGQQLWSKAFQRVECIAPAMIVDTHKQAAGVVITARESMIVLHPDDGRILYQLKCGNVIEAQPVVAGNRVFVGSSDSHVYCSDWQANQVLWDTEVGQDVLSLTMVEDTLIARVRGGKLVAMRAADGTILWPLDDETNPVRGVRRVGNTQVSLEMSEGGVQIRDAATGGLVKRVRPNRTEMPVRLLMANSSYFYFSERGDIGQVDEKGASLWRCRQSLRRITSLTMFKNRLIVTSGEGAVWLFSLKDGENKGMLTDD